MLRGKARFSQRDDIDRRVPDGRETRLNAEILRIIDEESGEIPQRLFVERMFFRIIERAQGDDGVEHRRENRGEPVAPLPDALDHPAFRFFQRPLRKSATVHRLEQLQGAIGAQEKISPGQGALIARQSEIVCSVPTG